MKAKKKINETMFGHAIQRAIERVWTTNASVRKVHPDMYESSGHADLSGVINGQSVEIELKIKPNRPSPTQLNALQRKANAGSVVFIVSLDRDTNKILWFRVRKMVGSLPTFSYREVDSISQFNEAEQMADISPLIGALK